MVNAVNNIWMRNRRLLEGKMKIDKNIANLIMELEYCIGRECYNPNSYNGYTGEEGCSFRYPVYTASKNEKGEYEETRCKLKLDNIKPENINTIKYKFGSNHLYIGLGLMQVLEELENRYDINFNELEKKRKK